MDKIPVSDLFSVVKSPLRKWRGIIIHCTGVIRIPGMQVPAYPKIDVFYGDAVDKLHRTVKGWRRGFGYHVGIGNMVCDKRIEVSDRWIYQTDGAHCRGKNSEYLGLVYYGDFTETTISISQENLGIGVIRKLLDGCKTISPFRIYPHNWWSSKSCPGYSFPFNRTLFILSRQATDREASWLNQ